jgi:predicted NAD-dependent protein-ADP-ribosyltransferase YbiA (DUF1768 family)
MDIRSGMGYPESALSNFSPHPFVLDGVEIASMEGFLQSLKFSDPEMQRYVCTLVGRRAKFKGKKKKWKRTGKLFWQGKEIDRFSDEYQLLLDRAFEAMFYRNEAARRALLATGHAVLEHSVGKKDPSETILTRSEFCSRLTRIRERLRQMEQDLGPRSSPRKGSVLATAYAYIARGWRRCVREK